MRLSYWLDIDKNQIFYISFCEDKILNPKEILELKEIPKEQKINYEKGLESPQFLLLIEMFEKNFFINEMCKRFCHFLDANMLLRWIHVGRKIKNIENIENTSSKPIQLKKKFLKDEKYLFCPNKLTLLYTYLTSNIRIRYNNELIIALYKEDSIDEWLNLSPLKIKLEIDRILNKLGITEYFVIEKQNDYNLYYHCLFYSDETFELKEFTIKAIYIEPLYFPMSFFLNNLCEHKDCIQWKDKFQIDFTKLNSRDFITFLSSRSKSLISKEELFKPSLYIHRLIIYLTLNNISKDNISKDDKDTFLCWFNAEENKYWGEIMKITLNNSTHISRIKPPSSPQPTSNF